MENFKSNIPPFYPNQKAVCIWGGGWVEDDRITECSGPGYNEKVTVTRCKFNLKHNTWMLFLKEWPNTTGWAYLCPGFGPSFVPIDEIKATRITFSEIEKAEELKESKEQELIFQN